MAPILSKKYRFTPKGRRVDTWIVRVSHGAVARRFRSLRKADQHLAQALADEQRTAGQRETALRSDLEDAQELAAQLVASENNKMTEIDDLKGRIQRQEAVLDLLREQVAEQRAELKELKRRVAVSGRRVSRGCLHNSTLCPKRDEYVQVQPEGTMTRGEAEDRGVAWRSY